MPVVSISPTEPIPMSLGVGPVPASKVQVFLSTLAEKTSKDPIAPRLRLCKSEKATECNSNDGIDLLPANSVAQLYLHGADGVGVYEGSVTVSSFEEPDGDAVTITVNLSSWWRKIWGVMAIGVSSLITMWVTVWLRNKHNRAQRLLPASEAIQGLTQLQTRRAMVKSPILAALMPSIKQRVTDALVQLGEDNLLKNGLPPVIPMTSNSTVVVTVEHYRKHVQALADWTRALQVLVHEGLVPAWAQYDKLGVNPSSRSELAASERAQEVISVRTRASCRARIRSLRVT